MSKHLTLSLFLFLVIHTSGQEYNYVHYDTRDGLAGSTVYRICQDKKGYIWFATDNGVSRFDGKHFKNFTTEDGLTDNEVLQIAADSHGRVWMSPFNKTICYYYEGQIHNSKNDSTLRCAGINAYLTMTGENKYHEVYFLSQDGIFLYPNSGHLKRIVDYNKLAAEYGVESDDFVPANLSNRYPYSMLLYNNDYLFYETPNGFKLLKKIHNKIPYSKNYPWIDSNLEVIPYKKNPPKYFTSVDPINDSLRFFNTFKGSWLINKNGVIGKPFFPDKQISFAIEDNEGNFWFATLGEGVYRLTSQSMKTFAKGEEFFCIEKNDGKIFAGASNGSLYTIKNSLIVDIKPFDKSLSLDDFTRLYTLKTDDKGNIFFGFDSYLSAIINGKRRFTPLKPIKSIDIVDQNNIVVCTSLYTLKLRSSDLKILDTIWRERGTKVIYENGNYYIGTLNGLVIVGKNGTKMVGENDPLLSKRIVDICKNGDGALWIATNDNGILLYRNGNVDTVINIHNGLSSNICKSLFLKGNYLWVGTNKGLNKIDVTTKKVLAIYSTSDGLASDVINAIYAEDSIIWICSPAGLTYFNEYDIQSNSICNLDLNGIHVSGKDINSKNLSLSPKNNNISFDYTAISFKAAGEVEYWYKLDGLDNNWKKTKLTALNYPSLPPGNYNFELYAVNKFGKRSNLVQVPFSIAAPFWKTTWFWTILALAFVLTVWIFIRYRYKKLQQRLEEKNLITKRIAELEQTSLRAQMNPHFIFNCLSSIQHFILKNDFEAANHYITQFANLIRQTLNNSSGSSISIEDEIKYLTNYLEMEQMRFTSKFKYEIDVGKNIDPVNTFIPPMILQPFVENAIRHGIRNKKDGTGLIKIKIQRLDHSIIFSVEDNGVGREVAATYKTGRHIEYQSKGITLTQDRLAMLTSENDEKIKTIITDLQDKDGNASGTNVTISFPLGVIEKLN